MGSQSLVPTFCNLTRCPTVYNILFFLFLFFILPSWVCIRFCINSSLFISGSTEFGSPPLRDLPKKRSIRGRLPNSVDPEIKSEELIQKRIQTHNGRIKDKNKKKKILYTPC